MGNPYKPAGTLSNVSGSMDGGITWTMHDLVNDEYYRCAPPKDARPEAHASWEAHIEVVRSDHLKRPLSQHTIDALRSWELPAKHPDEDAIVQAWDKRNA